MFNNSSSSLKVMVILCLVKVFSENHLQGFLVGGSQKGVLRKGLLVAKCSEVIIRVQHFCAQKNYLMTLYDEFMTLRTQCRKVS